MLVNLVESQNFLKAIVLILFCIAGAPLYPQTPAQGISPKDSLLALVHQSDPGSQKTDLLYKLCLVLNRSNLPGDMMSMATDALVVSRAANNVKGMGMSNYVIGYCQYAGRNYQEALRTISLAREKFEACGEKIEAGRCMYLTANILYDLGDYTGAVSHCTEALQTWDLIGFNQLKGPCCNDLALAYARMGNYSKGVEYAYKAFQASEVLANKKEMAQSLHLMGSLFYEFRNYENAMKNFTAASVIYEEMKDKFGFAQNNNMIGEILLAQGKSYDAWQKFNQSLSIYREPGAPVWGEPWGYSNIGSVYENQGDSASGKGAKEAAAIKYNDALENYLLSLSRFETIQDPAGAAEQTIYAGKTFFKLGQLSTAKKYLVKGLQMAREVGEKKNLASSYLYLSLIDSAEGLTGKAYEHYKLYVLYKDSIFNMETSQNLSLYKTQLEFEKKDHEITLLASENKLKTTLAERQSLRKRFAYGIIAAVILLGILGFYRYRRYNKINSEKKILKDRLAISQDLHDSIGSTLSSISVYSQVAKIHGEKNEQQDMSEVLEKISHTSNEMVTEMNDIVWAINPRNDSMEKIIQRMESFARPLAAARNIRFELTCDKSVLSLQLDMGIRKNFYLIFKEAVNNAIKYSGASELIATITSDNNQLMLTVADNGVGFSQQTEMAGNKLTLSGNGLHNMHKRAQELNGKLTIDSQPGKSTGIKLQVPLS